LAFHLVFTADIKSEAGAVISHVASDNYLGGRLAGEYMVKTLNGRKVPVLIPVEVTMVDKEILQKVKDN